MAVRSRGLGGRVCQLPQDATRGTSLVKKNSISKIVFLSPRRILVLMPYSVRSSRVSSGFERNLAHSRGYNSHYLTLLQALVLVCVAMRIQKHIRALYE